MRSVKLFFVGVLALAAMAPMSALTQTAAASPPIQSADLHGRYEVFYRYDHHDRWRLDGHYHSHREAHHAADHLRQHGYQVHVHHHDWNGEPHVSSDPECA